MAVTPLTIQEFEARVASFDWKGEITEVHPHHTADLKATWKGAASVESIRRHHVVTNKWRDFGQHVTLGPDGSIWLGRDWNWAPASATGHNGQDFGKRPFMIETFANFADPAHGGGDVLEGVQRSALIRIIAAVQEKWGLAPDAIRFHKEMGATLCPGNIDKAALIAAVRRHRAAASLPASRGDATRAAPSPPAPHQPYDPPQPWWVTLIRLLSGQRT